MATTAENIVSKGTTPSDWADAVAEMTQIVEDAYAELDKLPEDAQVPAKTFHTDEATGEVTEQELEDTVQHPLQVREAAHGLFAYRYEPCDDGSVVAVYVKGRDGNVGLVAFPSIEAASAWSPRDEA